MNAGTSSPHRGTELGRKRQEIKKKKTGGYRGEIREGRREKTAEKKKGDGVSKHSRDIRRNWGGEEGRRRRDRQSRLVRKTGRETEGGGDEVLFRLVITTKKEGYKGVGRGTGNRAKTSLSRNRSRPTT